LANAIILNAVDDTLRGLGFTRKKKHWYLATEETVLVVELQKCDWGDEYFLNLGVSLRELETDPFPRANGCQIDERLNMIAPNRALFERAMDLEDFSMSDEEGRLPITVALQNAGVPFLHRWDTKVKICARLQSKDIGSAAVWKSVYELCGLEPP
jgi:hypothetical protein